MKAIRMADCFVCFHYTRADDDQDAVKCEWCGDILENILPGWACSGCKVIYRDEIDARHCCTQEED